MIQKQEVKLETNGMWRIWVVLAKGGCESSPRTLACKEAGGEVQQPPIEVTSSYVSHEGSGRVMLEWNPMNLERSPEGRYSLNCHLLPPPPVPMNRNHPKRIAVPIAA